MKLVNSEISGRKDVTRTKGMYNVENYFFFSTGIFSCTSIIFQGVPTVSFVP